MTETSPHLVKGYKILSKWTQPLINERIGQSSVFPEQGVPFVF